MSYIPPQLGKPVNYQLVPFSELCKRAWGQEWGIPDIAYRFSNDVKKDSTDKTELGIYRR